MCNERNQTIAKHIPYLWKYICHVVVYVLAKFKVTHCLQNISTSCKKTRESCCCAAGIILCMCPAGAILCMRPTNESRRYIVKTSLIGWAHTQHGPSRCYDFSHKHIQYPVPMINAPCKNSDSMWPFIITQEVNSMFVLMDKQGIQTQYRDIISLGSNNKLYMEWQCSSAQ